MNYAGKHVLVLGLGESGLAMAQWLIHCGASVRVADTRAQPDRLPVLQSLAQQVEFVGGADCTADDGERQDVFKTALLDGIDFVAVSPGLMPARELAQIIPAAAAKEIPVWGEIELFAQALEALKSARDYRPRVIAITGTNGKTTVTSLVGLLCERAGLTVQIAGNISPAALDRLLDAVTHDSLPQVWVLELSSFQLHTTFSLQADAATVLNLSQDHLDWHGDMSTYGEDKARIFGSDTIRVLNRDDARVMQMATPAAQVITFGADEAEQPDCFGLVDENGMRWLSVAVQEDEPPQKRRKKNDVELEITTNKLMPVDALRIRGQHNAINALSALALCRAIGLSFAQLLHGLREYHGEPHRVEHVASIAGIDYFDDSKGTNVGATVAALNGLGAGQDGAYGNAARLLLIAGGDGKGQDFSPLNEPIAKYVRAVVLLGRDAAAIRQAIAAAESAGVVVIVCATLEEATRKAAGLAKAGDTVLLSPACASLDMFKNYAHRAQVFVDTVRDIALEHGEVPT
jgi:UDP-N-acetylmuramoylalanine--D-glutamate ligase